MSKSSTSKSKPLTPHNTRASSCKENISLNKPEEEALHEQEKVELVEKKLPEPDIIQLNNQKKDVIRKSIFNSSSLVKNGCRVDDSTHDDKFGLYPLERGDYDTFDHEPFPSSSNQIILKHPSSKRKNNNKALNLKKRPLKNVKVVDPIPNGRLGAQEISSVCSSSTENTESSDYSTSSSSSDEDAVDVPGIMGNKSALEIAMKANDQEKGDWYLHYRLLSVNDSAVLHQAGKQFCLLPQILGKVIRKGGEVLVNWQESIKDLAYKSKALGETVKHMKNTVDSHEYKKTKLVVKATSNMLEKYLLEFSNITRNAGGISQVQCFVKDQVFKILIGPVAQKKILAELKSLSKSSKSFSNNNYAAWLSWRVNHNSSLSSKKNSNYSNSKRSYNSNNNGNKYNKDNNFKKSRMS